MGQSSRSIAKLGFPRAVGASFGIRRGNRFLRIMFLGTAAVTGAILLWPWLTDTIG